MDNIKDEVTVPLSGEQRRSANLPTTEKIRLLQIKKAGLLYNIHAPG